MLQVACPSCRRKLSFPSSVAGTSVQCPHCSGWIDVPAGTAPVEDVELPPQRVVFTFGGEDVSNRMWLTIGAVLLFFFVLVPGCHEVVGFVNGR